MVHRKVIIQMVHRNVITQMVHRKITTSIQMVKLTGRHADGNRIYADSKRKVY